MGGKVVASAMSWPYPRDWVEIRGYCRDSRVFPILQLTLFGVGGESPMIWCRIAIRPTITSQEIGPHDNPEHTLGHIAIMLQASSYRDQRLASISATPLSPLAR
eukprot:TRINITY_DN6287_c0_g1_i1.p6 TRINITY_DN6287_c0_g1~~TRINITY_DN6287_c0_g1_i1.p6  ORF type:complete len:104 (-),score=3.48 TRINITY_DN6287_c0_g1_i1:1668-1979(-)